VRIDEQEKPSASTDQCPVSGIGREFNLFVDPRLAEPYRSADRFIFG
jgi:hypothetical protein